MKKLMTIFGAFLTASIVLTSCGSDDPKENGIDAGKLDCECKEIDEKLEENQKTIDRLDSWTDEKTSEETREEEAELQEERRELQLERADLQREIGDLKMKGYTATEKEDSKKHWDEDFEKAKDDYVKDNCKDD